MIICAASHGKPCPRGCTNRLRIRFGPMRMVEVAADRPAVSHEASRPTRVHSHGKAAARVSTEKVTVLATKAASLTVLMAAMTPSRVPEKGSNPSSRGATVEAGAPVPMSPQQRLLMIPAACLPPRCSRPWLYQWHPMAPVVDSTQAASPVATWHRRQRGGSPAATWTRWLLRLMLPMPLISRVAVPLACAHRPAPCMHRRQARCVCCARDGPSRLISCIRDQVGWGGWLSNCGGERWRRGEVVVARIATPRPFAAEHRAKFLPYISGVCGGQWELGDVL